MTAGDVGVAIVVNSGGYSLSGTTCVLLAWPAYPAAPRVALSLSPMTVSSDGTTATYITTGTDFTSGGNWNLALEVTGGSAAPYTSAPGSIYVYPNPRTNT